MKDKEREGLESGLISEKTIYDLASLAFIYAESW